MLPGVSWREVGLWAGVEKRVLRFAQDDNTLTRAFVIPTNSTQSAEWMGHPASYVELMRAESKLGRLIFNRASIRSASIQSMCGEEVPFGDWTRIKIAGLRQQLREKSIIEPVLDPSFSREHSKLNQIVTQTGELIDRLKEMLGLCEQIEGTLASLKDSVEKLARVDIPDHDSSAVKSMRDRLYLESLMSSTEDVERLYEQLHDIHNKLTLLNFELKATIHLPGIQLSSIYVRVKTYTLRSVWLWVVLGESANHLAYGARRLYKIPEFPHSIEDGLSDASEAVLDRLHIFNAVPILHIMKIIWDRMNRQSIQQSVQQARLSDEELDLFLLAYYEWWADHDGYKEMSEDVEELGASILRLGNDVIELSSSTSQVEGRVLDYMNLINEQLRLCLSGQS